MGLKQRLITTLFSVLTLAAALICPEAAADHPRRSSNSYGKSSSNNGTSTRTTLGRRASPHRTPQTPSIPQNLLPPAGSATNVRPGYYQQLNAPAAQQGNHGHGVSYVVYVPTAPSSTAPRTTIPYQVSPQRTHSIQNGPPIPSLKQTAPQPVYVVNPPREIRAPQPVYLVDPNSVGTPAAGVSAVQPLPSPKAPSPPPSIPPAKPSGPVHVEYRIAPIDAEVYLDDELLGTGRDLVDAADTLELKPGVHVLEVTHPDYRPQRVVFGVSSSKPLKVAVDLTTERIGRRSRVR